MKRSISLIIALILIISTGTAFAETVDYEKSWAKDEISYMMGKGIINGYPDGTFKPTNNMNKAEFYTVINGLVGYSEKAELVEYEDVNPGNWYYGQVQKALKANYLPTGKTLNPEEKITRGEVARIIGIVFDIEEDILWANKFVDSSTLPKEIKGIVGGLRKNGYIAGYPDGTFRHESNISRAEVVKMLHTVSGEIANEASTINKDVKTNLVVSTKDVVLKDMVIEGNLYLTEGIGEGDVTLNNIEVKGELSIKGGGENSIKIQNSKINKVSIGKQQGRVRVVFENTTVNQVTTLREVKIELTNGTKIETVELDGNVELAVGEGTAINALSSVSKEVNIESKGTIESIKTTADVKVNGDVIKSGTEVKVDAGKAKEVKPKETAKQEATTPSPRPRPTEPESPQKPTPQPPPITLVSAISVNKEATTLAVGATETLVATVLPSNAADKTVTWTSDKESVATVDQNGLVTAVAAGTATITAKAGNFEATCVVTVNPVTPPAYASTGALTNPTVTVANGTTEAGAIAALDPTVGVVGTNSEAGTATIAWTIASYDGNTAGDYAATGVLTLPAGWTGTARDVTATVAVLPAGVEPGVDNAADFKAAIENNALSTITLSGDITGNVTATRVGSNSFTIDFGTYALTGNLDITTANAKAINLNGTAAPAITGDLTVSAANATVTNGISVGGTITIEDVGKDSWVENTDGNTITLTASNGATIVINGKPEDIKVEEGAGGGINITANSPVTITVDSGANIDSITTGEKAAGTSITNNGTVSNVTANSSMSLAVGSGATVSNITASEKAAGTSITNNGTVSNVTANADVDIENNSGNVNIEGSGTIGISGTSSSGENITGTAKIVTGISSSLAVDAELRMGAITTANITGITLETGESLNVTSANSEIVKVDAATGLAITALKPGKVAITVQVKNASNEVIKQGTIFVTVLPELISSASVTMVAPVLGETPQTVDQVETASTDYEVANIKWNEKLTPAGKFKAGETYTATVVLTSKNDKAFQQGAFTPTVANADSVGTTTTIGKTVGNRVSFTVTFPTTDALEVTGIEVKNQPTKMTYAEDTDDKLALNGMVITETNNDGTTRDVTFTNGTAAGYTTDPANGATLTKAEHDGKAVTITHTASGQTATTDKLTVLGVKMVGFTSLTANGADGVATTTELTLTFDIDPVTLGLDDIVVSGATKEALTGTGTTRTLTISNITVANGETVNVTILPLEGYIVEPTSLSVAVWVEAGLTKVYFEVLVGEANGINIGISKHVDGEDYPEAIDSIEIEDFILIKDFVGSNTIIEGIRLDEDFTGGFGTEYMILPPVGETFAVGEYRLGFSKAEYETAHVDFTIEAGAVVDAEVEFQEPLGIDTDKILICIFEKVGDYGEEIPALEASDLTLIKNFGKPSSTVISGISLEPGGGTWEYNILPPSGETFGIGEYRLIFDRDGYELAYIEFVIEKELEAAKTAAERELASFIATNATTENDIFDIVSWSIRSENIIARWKNDAGFQKTNAQVNQTGLITGTIELVESGERILEVLVNKEIPMLVEVREATITGTAKVGKTLIASANIDATIISYQWQVADSVDGQYANIDGATNEEIVLSEDQLGKFIKVVINGLESSTATSAATEKVAAAYKGITSVSIPTTKVTLGEEIDLTAVTVEPADATNQTIIWTLLDDGGTGVTAADISEGKFTPTAIGQLKLGLRIINGVTESKDFTYEFWVTVTAAKPEARFGTPPAQDSTVTLENLLANTYYKWVIGESPDWYSGRVFTTEADQTTQELGHIDFVAGAKLHISAGQGALVSDPQTLVVTAENIGVTTVQSDVTMQNMVLEKTPNPDGPPKVGDTLTLNVTMSDDQPAGNRVEYSVLVLEEKKGAQLGYINIDKTANSFVIPAEYDSILGSGKESIVGKHLEFIASLVVDSDTNWAEEIGPVEAGTGSSHLRLNQRL